MDEPIIDEETGTGRLDLDLTDLQEAWEKLESIIDDLTQEDSQ